MNCVAIPPSEEKRRTMAVTSSTPSQPSPPVHMMRSEITLTTAIVEPFSNNVVGNNNNSSSSSNGVANRKVENGPDSRNRDSKVSLQVGGKTRSLQRTATTHLYCRSLDKEAAAGALAVSQRKLVCGSLLSPATAATSATASSSSSSSSSRGFASCLRGERDDSTNNTATNDYHKHIAPATEAITIIHQPKQQQLIDQIDDELDENHPVKVLQTSLLSVGSGGESVAGGSRKFYTILSIIT